MKLFGTDGIRGRAGEFPLDPISVRLLGRELARRLSERGGNRRVVLGGDTRESTPRIVADLAAGLREGGCGVAPAGIITTPGIAELVLELGASAGIAVSASHNPYQDNGIKIFGADGRKWPDEEEEYLEKKIVDGRGRHDAVTTPAPPDPDPGLTATYVSRLKGSVPADLDGLPVLMDAGNGAAFQIGPRAFHRAGARVTAIHDSPDGHNINDGCGALHPEAMASRMPESGAALGVAFDGDADRSIFADETGRVLDGDDALWIIARDWKRRGILSPGGVVGTVMSNFGLEQALARDGIAFRRAAVGDRNVARLMDETGAVLGGETSGHVLLAPLSPAGDGILTALVLSGIVHGNGGRLAELATLEKVPQTLRNVRVARRVPIEEAAGVRVALARAEEALKGRGRVFLRYSGTEPLLRILVEGVDAGEVDALASEIEAAVRAELT
ncbi:MAG TPA: phosphoglucosamine mutase [Thermoanaerobaculia bacterium]